MSEPKPFASLSPTLLARKGSARPAMRPQFQPLMFEEDRAAGFGGGAMGLRHAAHPEDDLGWNDMGEPWPGDPQPAAPAPTQSMAQIAAPAPVAQPRPAAVEPVVVPINAHVAVAVEPEASKAADAAAPEPVIELAQTMAQTMAKSDNRRRGSALKHGRKAAFTLRVDSDRHLRLRLACAMQNRSAQQLITEALDRLLADLPGLKELTSQMKRT